MDMVERVAQAMAGAPMDKFHPAGADVWRKRARAAIAEMREPNHAMLSAFDRACDDSGQCLAKFGYRAMISAALGDQP